MTWQPPPTMAEVAAAPRTGHVAASLFAGAGGSSVGYRLAGLRVAWANDNVPDAAACYRANADPDTVLDTRDARDVTGDDIRAACGGDPDLLDGSPPCVAFSSAGKRHRDWGRAAAPRADGSAGRTDDLIYEYARLVREARPRVFLMENVLGLTRGVALGLFTRLLADLRAAGYRVDARELDAQWLGVPQQRRRVFVQGVRADAPGHLAPAWPDPRPRTTVRAALPHLVGQADNGGYGKGRFRPTDRPSPTIGAQPVTGNGHWPASRVLAQDGPGDPVDRTMTLAEARVLCGFPPDFVLPGGFRDGWARLGNAVPPPVARHTAAAIIDQVLRPWDHAQRRASGT